MKIHHEPKFDIEKVIEHYSQKDGVPIRYVATTELEVHNLVGDVFYRETPHPEFGNRYFRLYHAANTLMIASADHIENYEFEMIESNNEWHYSKARHDFHSTPNGAIDGGRAYTRIIGTESGLPNSTTMKVKDGGFVDV